MKNKYYILITNTGKRIPVCTKVTIKSVKIADFFIEESEHVIAVLNSNFIEYLIENA